MKVKTDTIIRTIVLTVALINQILVSTGHSVLPVTEDGLTEALSAVFTFIASVVAWWKNNSFSKNAIKADEYLEELRGEE